MLGVVGGKKRSIWAPQKKKRKKKHCHKKHTLMKEKSTNKATKIKEDFGTLPKTPTKMKFTKHKSV